MTLEAIHAAIPHRPPMLLVDEIVERDDNRIVCQKTFRADEFFFQGHYPGHPIVPGVILCESGMQAGAILLSQFVTEGAGVPVATRLNDVKFKRIVRLDKGVRTHLHQRVLDLLSRPNGFNRADLGLDRDD